MVKNIDGNAIIGARALPTQTSDLHRDRRDRLHVATAVKQQVRLPCHHHHHPPTAFTKGTKTCQTNTRACASLCLPRAAYFNPSANVRLAHAGDSEGTEEGATAAFSFMYQQPGFKIEAQILSGD